MTVTWGGTSAMHALPADQLFADTCSSQSVQVQPDGAGLGVTGLAAGCSDLPVTVTLLARDQTVLGRSHGRLVPAHGSHRWLMPAPSGVVLSHVARVQVTFGPQSS